MVVQGGTSELEIVSYMSLLISDYKFSKYPIRLSFCHCNGQPDLAADYSWLIITLPEAWAAQDWTGVLYNS